MPVSSSQNIRLFVLDQCLRNQREKYTFNALLDKVNEKLERCGKPEIAIRQLRKDLREIRSIIKKHEGDEDPIALLGSGGKEKYYRYKNPKSSIYKNQLSDDELADLLAVLNVLKSFRKDENDGWLSDIIEGLEEKFGEIPDAGELISFEDYKNQGASYLAAIVDAVINHQKLVIYYQPYHKEEEHWDIDPYYLKQFNGRWFLFGWNEDKGMLYNMALDRITGVYDGYGEFRTNKDIDFSTYFDDIIGVTRPRKKLEDGSFVDVDSEKILLRFSERRFPYAKSKPIHNSFQVVSEEDCTASIIVRPNNEFFARVLEYGPDVEIVSPDSVRELIKRKVNEMYEKYFSVQHECTDNK